MSGERKDPSRRRGLGVDWVHDAPERVQQDFGAALDAPDRDLLNPFCIGRFGRHVMRQRLVNLVRHRAHQASCRPCQSVGNSLMQTAREDPLSNMVQEPSKSDRSVSTWQWMGTKVRLALHLVSPPAMIFVK